MQPRAPPPHTYLQGAIKVGSPQNESFPQHVRSKRGALWAANSQKVHQHPRNRSRRCGREIGMVGDANHREDDNHHLELRRRHLGIISATTHT